MSVGEALITAINTAGDKLVDGPGRDLVADLIEDGTAATAKLPEELREPAKVALLALAEPAVIDATANITKVALGKVVGFFASGSDEDLKDAERIYMATEAGTQERIDFQNASGDSAELLYAKRSAEWDALVEVFTRIGKVALSALATMALGALGL
jgi:hypothetical protein